jgi:hypothetical protein
MKPSILSRLEKLENECRFVNWFLGSRFIASLNENELEAYSHEGKLPDPAPNRLSRLDRLDRDSLQKQWQKDERFYEGRTREDLRRFCEQGIWPEQLGRLHYSSINGGVHVEWRVDAEVESHGLAHEPRNDDGLVTEADEPAEQPLNNSSRED